MDKKQINIGTLQETINKRAEQRLVKDLHELGNYVGNNKLLKIDGLPTVMFNNTEGYNYTNILDSEGKQRRVYLNEDLEKEKITKMFGVSGSGQNSNIDNIWGSFLKKMFSLWLPKYIEEETKIFMNKIEEMESNVEYLLNTSNK